MAKTKISEFDSTPANNTDIDSINIAEGCAPSGINNAIRELMSQLKDQQTGASGDNFTVGGNLAVTGTSTFTGATTFSAAVVMSTALPIASGGTGASTAGNARTSIGAASSGANSDITSLTGLTTALSVAQGGTGAATFSANNVLLGNGTSALQVVAPSTSGNVLTSNGTTWVSSAGAYALTSGTAVSSTSGTSIDFTSIPSWVKRITVMFSGVSLNGSSSYLVQLGDSGGVETTGYTSTSITTDNTGGSASVSSTSGFVYFGGDASYLQNGLLVITNLTGNIWVSNHSGNLTATNVLTGGGTKTLSATLDRVRITTVNGTDTFDAGSINILYE